MKHPLRLTTLFALCLSAGAGLAQAQEAGRSTDPNARGAWSRSADSYSLLPYTRRGYLGINLGKPEFKIGCGVAPFECDDPQVSGYLYTGGFFTDWVGMEIGYLNSGKADRAGGSTRAQGVNLSLVLRAPLGAFNAFAKGGAVYSETRVSASPLALDVTEGKRRGWGGSYGVGVGFDLTPNAGVVLEWSRYEMRFPGADGRDKLETTSLGYVHRF